MTMTVTERDKKLLAFLAVLLIAVLMIFQVILPLLARNAQLKSDLVDAQILQTENLQKASGLNTVREKVEAEQRTLAEAQSALLPMMESSDIDGMMTQMAVDCGAQMVSMAITMPEPGEFAELEPYCSDGVDRHGEQEEESSLLDGVYGVEVQMAVTGSREQLRQFIDNCAAQEPKLRITSYSWTDLQGEYRLNMGLCLYMAAE